MAEEGDEEFSAIMASISPLHLQELALTTRRKLYNDLLPETSCVVSNPPRMGSFNIVYELVFSDGMKWAIRVPATGNVFSPSRLRSFHLDIVAQRFTSSKTSIPVPRIHHWSLDSHTVLSYPFVIMDFLPGTNLSKFWNDKNWISDAKREIIFNQIAGWMTELATFEFDQIGRLTIGRPKKTYGDWDATSEMYRVVPFPDRSALMTDIQRCKEPNHIPIPFGSFNTAHSFLTSLLSIRREASDSPMLAVLQLFFSALIDGTLDGPPFVLSHPDFDSQNVLVDDDSTITGIIDWDNVDIRPRGAAAYPMWLTVDWDPLFYGWSKDASPENNAAYDSPAEIASYRRSYLDAIARASSGKLTHIARNSHIWTTLYIALSNGIATSGIVDHLSRFVFGSGLVGCEVEEGIRRGAWYALSQRPGTIAEFTDDTSPET